MIDIITYIPDLLAFKVEAQANAESNILGFSIDDNGEVNYNIAKIPVFYNELQSICLIRLSDNKKEWDSASELDVFNSMETCQRIGACENGEYIFDEGGKTIYEAVYDTTAENAAYMIGVFA